jgi:LuxR family maltose regulon positive regulatory protein
MNAAVSADHAPPQHAAHDASIRPFRCRDSGAGQLVKPPDLRFSAEESAMFFNEGMRLDLTEGQLLALQSRTEGWIAGLKMAALSLEGRSDINSFIDNFTGVDRYVLDYLLEEVLGRQPEELQRVMLELSVLDRFTGSLCGFTGYGDGSGLLEKPSATCS